MANLFRIDRVNNKIGFPFHTASTILGLDASKDLESLAIPLIVANGGSGAATLTDHGILLGSGTDAITSLGVAANGKIPIGSAGADPVLAEITGTANQIISTPGAGSITLSTPQNIHTGATDFEVAGLKVVNKITEFSTDGTMGDNSDSAVPTEKATKLYTDTLRSDLASTANAKGASLVGIEDSMSLFTATEVESALEEVMDAITIVTLTADSVTMDVGSAVGVVANTQTINDGNVYNIDETTGPPNPNFVATFDFSGIATGHEPNLIELHWSYNGTAGHTIELQMYNYDTTTWDTIDSATFVNTSGTLTFDTFTIMDGGGAQIDYTSGGAARVRFNHANNGISSHDFVIDYLAIKDDHGIGSGITDHGALSGLLDDDHDPLYLRTDGTRTLAGTWDMGSQALTNVNIDSGVITGITDLAIADGGTGQGTAQTAINALSAVSGATNEHVLTKDTGTGNAIWKATGGADAEKVKVDVGATADYIGAANSDGVLRTGTSLSYADGGNFVTINAIQDIQTSANPQFAGLGLGVAATAGTMVVRSLGADGEDIFVIERSTSDLLIVEYLSDAGTDSCSLHLKKGGTTLVRLTTHGTDDTYFNMAGGLVIGGTDAKTKLTVEGSITLKEQAAADGDTVAYGQIWVKDSTPNELYFTDDAGTDFRLSADGDNPTSDDSESNAMLKDHAYLAQTAGFVDVFMPVAAVNNLRGFVGTTNDPAGAGTQVQNAATNAVDTSRLSIHFFVANGNYFEVTSPAGTPTINWTPFVTGGAAPIDQEAP